MKKRFYTHRGQLFYVLRGDKDGSHTAIGVGPTLDLWYSRANLYGVDVRVLKLLVVKITYVCS